MAGAGHGRRRPWLVSAGQGADLDQVVGQDSVSDPDPCAFGGVDPAAIPSIAAFQAADPAFAIRFAISGAAGMPAGVPLLAGLW